MAASIKSLPPAEAMEEEAAVYDLHKVKAPVVTGLALRFTLGLLLEGPRLVSAPFRSHLFRLNGYPQALEEVFLPEKPTFFPHTSGWRPEAAEAPALVTLPAGQGAVERAAAAAKLLPGFSSSSAAPGDGSSSGAPSSGPQPRRWRISDFHHAYQSGETTPAAVAENIVRAVEDSEQRDPPMRFFISFDPAHLRQQAAASTQRYAAGAPLSPLDGVPFAVKDCVDVLPYPSTAGTAFMGDWRPVTATCAAVQSLLDAGAMLLGKANMHEIGLGTTGLNTVHGTPRNPHDVWRHTGGSSSGSGALVAAGICPIAVGSDGGGSIRIPSALCGCVGLAPTPGRVWSTPGPPIDHTVAVIGPIAGSVEDCLLMYSVMANAGHPPGQEPPPLRLPRTLPSADPGSGLQPLRGQVAGIYWKWFEDADQAVVQVCKAAVGTLEKLGLEVRSVAIPELDALRVAHTCTIVSEMRNSLAAALAAPAVRRQLNMETQVSLSIAASFTSAHYIQAQKVRSRTEAHFRRVLGRGRGEGGCDFLITPTVPCVAPEINRASLAGGISDVGTTISLMRFLVAVNMLGLPAVSVPVGTVPTPRADLSRSRGRGAGADTTVPLPVGLQLMARPWHEASLLHAARALEAALAREESAAVALPAVYYDVLQPAQ